MARITKYKILNPIKKEKKFIGYFCPICHESCVDENELISHFGEKHWENVESRHKFEQRGIWVIEKLKKKRETKIQNSRRINKSRNPLNELKKIGFKSKKKLSKEDKSKRYRAYLLSKEWKEIREIILERDGYRCSKCGSERNLEIHHLNYKHIFFEKFFQEDLITLCEKCHKKIHDQYKKK